MINFGPGVRPSRWFLFGVIFFHQVLTALAFPAAKLGLGEINPFVFAFFRFAIASMIYIPVLLFLRRGKKITAREHLRIFIIGLVLIPCNQVIFLVGQSLTSAGHSSLLFATMPIFVYILAMVFLGERFSIRRSAGIAIAVIGVYFILTGGKVDFGIGYLLGDLIILVAVVAWAVGTVMMKPLAMKFGAFRVTGLALVYGSLVYLPYGLYRAYGADLSQITMTGWGSVLYLALVVSILAYFLWYWVLKYLEASRVAVVQNIQPVIASAAAAVVLSEPITENFIIGGIIVITGVILTEL